MWIYILLFYSTVVLILVLDHLSHLSSSPVVLFQTLPFNNRSTGVKVNNNIRLAYSCDIFHSFSKTYLKSRLGLYCDILCFCVDFCIKILTYDSIMICYTDNDPQKKSSVVSVSVFALKSWFLMSFNIWQPSEIEDVCTWK